MAGYRGKKEKATAAATNRKKSTKGPGKAPSGRKRNEAAKFNGDADDVAAGPGNASAADSRPILHRRRPFGLSRPQLNSIVFLIVTMRELYQLRRSVIFPHQALDGQEEGISLLGSAPCATYYRLPPDDAAACTAADSAALLLRYHSSSRFSALAIVTVLICWLNESKLQAFMQTIAASPLMTTFLGWRMADWVVQTRHQTEIAIDPDAAAAAVVPSAFSLMGVDVSQKTIATTFGLLALTYMGRDIPPVPRRRLPLLRRDCRLHDGAALFFVGYLVFSAWCFAASLSDFIPDGSRVMFHWTLVDELSILSILIFGLICCSNNENSMILFFYGAVNLFYAKYQLSQQQDLFFSWGVSTTGINSSDFSSPVSLYGRTAFGFLASIVLRSGIGSSDLKPH